MKQQVVLGIYLTEIHPYVHQKTCMKLLLRSIHQNHPQLKTTLILISTKLEKQTLIYSFSGYSTVMKKNELLLHATTCMKLKNITLDEKNQIQKNTYCMILFNLNLKTVRNPKVINNYSDKSLCTGDHWKV